MTENTKDKILIINDVTGYGRVSSFAMMPTMTAYGLHPYVLPTALVSNTMDYGSSVILDTTQFMKDCISQWDKLGFKFDVISTGLINSQEQADIILNLIDSQKPRYVMVDPIMADDGKLYPGMYQGAIECYRKLAAHADLIIPNYTEATILADKYKGRDTLTFDEYKDLANSLVDLGCKNLVITGCRSNDGMNFNLVYDENEIIMLEYDKIPIALVGTGDVFSATLLSSILRENTLAESVNNAAQLVRKVVKENIDNTDHYDIYIERTLQEATYEIRQR